MYIKTNNDFYKITGIVMDENGTTVNLQSDEGDPVDLDFYQSFTVPEAALTGKTDEDVIAWLTGPDGPFTGGEYLTTSEYDLGKAQALKYAEIKARRIELEEGGLLTSFGVVDSDPDSQRKIAGGVQMAMISMDTTNTIAVDDGQGGTTQVPFATAFFPNGFDLTWRFADNSIDQLTAEEVIQMGVETGKQVAQYQMAKNYFDGLVTAATTVAEVEAIDAQVDWLAITV